MDRHCDAQMGEEPARSGRVAVVGAPEDLQSCVQPLHCRTAAVGPLELLRRTRQRRKAAQVDFPRDADRHVVASLAAGGFQGGDELLGRHGFEELSERFEGGPVFEFVSDEERLANVNLHDWGLRTRWAWDTPQSIPAPARLWSKNQEKTTPRKRRPFKNRPPCGEAILEGARNLSEMNELLTAQPVPVLVPFLDTALQPVTIKTAVRGNPVSIGETIHGICSIITCARIRYDPPRKSRLHARRTAGGNRHHRHPHRPFAPGGAGGEGGGPADSMCEPLPPGGHCAAQLQYRARVLSARFALLAPVR